MAIAKILVDFYLQSLVQDRYMYISLEPRLTFVGGKESLVHTVCACVNISVKISVKLSGYYQQTRGLGTYTAMSGENTETKIKPHEEPANNWFSKDKTSL